MNPSGLIVLDTDAASNLLRRRNADRIAVLLAGHTPALTFVTIGELTKWTLVRHWGPDRRDQLRRFIDQTIRFPYDQLVAEPWGQIQADAQLRGRPRPDQRLLGRRLLPRPQPALIALNTKDDTDFAEHHGLHSLGQSSRTYPVLGFGLRGSAPPGVARGGLRRLGVSAGDRGDTCRVCGPVSGAIGPAHRRQVRGRRRRVDSRQRSSGGAGPCQW